MNLNSVSESVDLECIVCLAPFTPPIYQCSNGHLICHECEPHCKLCPVCRKPMPREKIRNIAHEKTITFLANSLPCPCPFSGNGCTVILQKSSIEEHKFDCSFAKKKLCTMLGLSCNEEHSTSQMNEIITHLIFDHNLDGSICEGGDISTSKLELLQTCKKTELKKYLGVEWSKPNFIGFEDKIFFVRKKVNASLKMVGLVVCIDASLNTTRKYSAVVQLLPGQIDSSVRAASPSPTFQFKQDVVARLTDNFDLNATNPSKFCKISFSEMEQYGKINEIRKGELSWKLHVQILKNLEPFLVLNPIEISTSESALQSSSTEQPMPLSTSSESQRSRPRPSPQPIRPRTRSQTTPPRLQSTRGRSRGRGRARIAVPVRGRGQGQGCGQNSSTNAVVGRPRRGSTGSGSVNTRTSITRRRSSHGHGSLLSHVLQFNDLLSEHLFSDEDSTADEDDLFDID